MFNFNQDDFQAWLENNQTHLAEYNPFQVAELAVSCGFPLSVVTPDTSEWIRNSTRRLRLWESEFRNHWVDLWAYQSHGVEFDS